MSKIDGVPEEFKNRDDVKLVANDVDLYSALHSVALSEGGQILADRIKKDIKDIIDTFASQHGTMNETALRSLGAKLSVMLPIYRALVRAGDNLSDTNKELEELIR